VIGRTRRGHGARWVLVALLVPFAVSCSSYTSISEKTRELIAKRDYSTAIAEIDKASSGPDDLLLLMERGLLHHYNGDYAASNDAFQAAEDKMDELYTRRLSTEAASMITSDRIRPYEGAHYERVMIHFYRALNYIALRLRDDALVEARKASSQLAFYTQEMEEPAYGDDPFIEYFTGLLYEWGGEPDNAYVSFRKAEAAYGAVAGDGGLPVPRRLAGDLIRTADELRFRDDAAEWRESYPQAEAGARGAGVGEVILVVESGFVPKLIEHRIDIPILKADNKDRGSVWIVAEDAFHRRRMGRFREAEIDYWLSIAYPGFEAIKSDARSVRVRCDGDTHTLLPVSDLAFNSVRDFRDREKTILVRTIARALIKYLAKEGAEKEGGPAAGIIMNIFGAVTEGADTRSWRSLPRTIHLARFPISAGTHEIVLESMGNGGHIGDRVVLSGVEVQAGRTSWVTYRFFR